MNSESTFFSSSIWLLGEVWNGRERWHYSSLGFYVLGSGCSETPNLLEPNNTTFFLNLWLDC